MARELETLLCTLANWVLDPDEQSRLRLNLYKPVTFPDELVETDESFQDYVIVHKLLHLRYPSHGDR